MSGWDIDTYDGLDINDGTNYEAYFPQGTVLSTGTVDVKLQKRPGAFPQVASVTPKERNLQVVIKLLGTLETQRNTLATKFDLSDTSRTLKVLKAKDESDSDKPYYLSVKPIAFTFQAPLVIITFVVPDWRWKEVSESQETKTNPSHNATHTITPGGNIPTDPILKISPTAQRTSGGTRSRRFIEVVNELSSKPLINYSINITDAEAGGGYDTASDIANTTNSVQIDNIADITDSATTIDYDTEVGTLPSAGVGYVDTEQISWEGKSGTQLTTVVRGLGGTTPAAHLNNAVITESLMMANGHDIEIFMDGQKIDRYLADMNGADTKIWIVADWGVKTTLTLRTAIGATGAISQIEFTKNTTNYRAFEKLPESGNLKIDDEYFTYTSKDGQRLRVQGITRQAFGSGDEAHTVSDTVTVIDHEIWMYYGNQASVDPNTPDAADRQPMFEHDNSSNTSHVYTSFATDKRARSQEWAGDISKVYPSGASNNEGVRLYTANRDTIADPASEMGLRIQSVLGGTQFAQTFATLHWSIFNPVGMTAANISGEKYRDGTKWPQKAALQFSNDGQSWVDEFDEATPASNQTWAALTNDGANSFGATYTYVRLLLSGGVSGGSAVQNAKIEVTSMTMTLAGANEPTTLMRDQNEFEGTVDNKDTYQLSTRLTNQTTGEAIEINQSMEVGQPAAINCAYQNNYIQGLDFRSHHPQIKLYLFLHLISTSGYALHL